jgi:hypothetical protein
MVSIPPGWESIPGLLKSFSNTGSGFSMKKSSAGGLFIKNKGKAVS